MAAKTATVVTPTAVRTWAAENGHTVKERGRLHSDIIDAYNKSHKIKFDSAIKADAGTKIALKGKRKTANGRTVPWSKTVSTTEIRTAAKAAGIPLGDRGRLPQDVIQAFANDTLNDLAAGWQTRTDKMLERRATGFQVLASDALTEEEAKDSETEDEVSDEQDSEQDVTLEAPADGETSEVMV